MFVDNVYQFYQLISFPIILKFIEFSFASHSTISKLGTLINDVICICKINLINVLPRVIKCSAR